MIVHVKKFAYAKQKKWHVLIQNVNVKSANVLEKRKRMILYAKERTVLDANTTAAMEVTYAKVKHGKPDNRLLQTRSVVQANWRRFLIGNAVMHFATFMAIPYCNLTDDNIEVQWGEILAVAEECYPEEIVEEPSIDGLTDDDQDLVHCNQLQVLEPKEDLDPAKLD